MKYIWKIPLRKRIKLAWYFLRISTYSVEIKKRKGKIDINCIPRVK